MSVTELADKVGVTMANISGVEEMPVEGPWVDRNNDVRLWE